MCFCAVVCLAFVDFYMLINHFLKKCEEYNNVNNELNIYQSLYFCRFFCLLTIEISPPPPKKKTCIEL